MSTTFKIVVLLFLTVLFRVVLDSLLGEIASDVCFLAAVSIGALAWRRSHPRREEQLDDQEAHRIEDEKLARFGQ